MRYTLCKECGQPIKPGRHRKDEYRHALGCPRDYSKYRVAPKYKLRRPHPLHIEGVTGRLSTKGYFSDMTRRQKETAQEILRGLGK